MTETAFWISAGVYLGVGLIALAILDALTGRVRGRILDAGYETQIKMAGVGTFLSRRMALVVIMLALWGFWPFAIYAAISTIGKKERNDK